MIEVDNILNILKQTKKAIAENNPLELKRLSNQTIHSASTNQDQENISIAVTIYSLGKIYQREHYKKLEGWENFNRLINNSLNLAIKYLEKGDLENYKKNFALIGKAINKISGKLKNFISDVFEKARINKASKIHEHGISLGKTAKLLGVTLYDLATYTGTSGVSDIPLNKTIDIKQRIKFAEEIFS